LSGTLLDGVPSAYRAMMWEETKRCLAAWPDDPAIDVAWVTLDWDGEHIELQMDRAEAERIAAWRPTADEWLAEIGAEPDSIAS